MDRPALTFTNNERRGTGSLRPELIQVLAKLEEQMQPSAAGDEATE